MALKIYKTTDGRSFIYTRQVTNITHCGGCAFKSWSGSPDCPGWHGGRDAIFKDFPEWCNGDRPECEYLEDTPKNRAEALARLLMYGSETAQSNHK